MSADGQFQLLCLGNPLLDIQAGGDQALLDKYGLKSNDAILAEEKHMGIYDDLFALHAKVIAGGAAQNSSRGAAYILPPDSVIYIGCVGKDDNAKKLESACQAGGLKTLYRYDEDHPTGRCGAVITGHDRSLVTDLAAANHYKLEHLKSPEIWPYVENAEVFYVGGFHLTVCPPAILTLAEEAAKKNKIFALALSAPFIAEFFKDALDETEPYWDYLIGNEAEAAAYAKSHDLNLTSVHDIAKHLATLPKKNTKRPRTVIITQGTDPTIVVTSDGKGDPQTREFPVHPVAAEEITDTNGAGDAFAGGLIAGITQGDKLEKAIDMGHWLASLSIRELGPSYPFPKKIYGSKSATYRG
ncbi:MAG: adenosine kinase [Bogoriella megaspora]|nr:MAG: adenosine kinase [Bogoriella megaspora]